MKYGKQVLLAKKISISPQTLNDYLAGRSGASAQVADKLATLLKTDIRLWLKGGDPVERKEALKKWAATLK